MGGATTAGARRARAALLPSGGTCRRAAVPDDPTHETEPEAAPEPAPYPGAFECDVVLADGAPVHLRPVRPEDAEAIRAFHAGLSEESVYLRFFSLMKELPPSLLQRFTHVDHDARVVLLALLGDEVIAMASYDRAAGAGEAEVAFAVADAHQRRGLGTLLLEHLAEIARTRGVTRFVADTLPHNRPMLGLFRNSGFVIERRPDGGTIHVAFPIEPTEAYRGALEQREHEAEARSVARILAPKSVAVVGASPTPGKVGHEILRNVLAGGFRGRVFAVHPRAASILGAPTHPRVTDVPGELDLAVIAVPREEVEGVVRDCAEKGVDALVVISSGFAETGPDQRALERRVVDLALRHGMRLVGPNCIGVVNTDPAVSLNATFAGVTPLAGPVGFLSQSGALGIVVLAETRALELGVSSFVSIGNKADVSGNDVLQYWEEDPATRLVLLYLESLGNPRKFSRIARRVAKRKPIVALKSGASTSGRRGASSHTAALATPEVAVDALFRQAGVIRVTTTRQLLDVAQLLAHQPLPAGRRVAVVGNSGGPGILAADACERAGLLVPELSAGLQASLRASLPEGAGVRNPVDAVSSATPAQLGAALARVAGSGEVDALLAIYTPVRGAAVEDVAAAVAEAAAGAKDRPVLASFLTLGTPPAALVRDGRRVPCFPFPELAAEALGKAAEYAEWRARPEGTVPPLPGIDAVAARRVVRDALARAPDGGWLGAEARSALLAAYGVPLVASERVDGAGAAAVAAARCGFPVALKAASPELVHKSDVGGVMLGLDDAGAVREAYTTMERRLGARMGGALVQPMAEPGVETIVGVVHDPSFGPLLLFGLGGTAVELLQDRAFRLLPLTDLDAAGLVRSLRTSPLLFGHRGAKPADVPALEQLLLRVGRLASEVPEIAELDLNPVIVSPGGVAVVDTKLRLAPYAPRPELGARRLR
jgi:acetyl coenzyme A synthetase (ADP forming)-like protein